MSDRGLAILPTCTFESSPLLDLICLPGGPGVGDALTDDETMVLRREDERISDRLTRAKPNADDEAERARLRKRIENWEDRRDIGYQSWREDIYQRRFRQPEVTRLLDIDFLIAGVGGQASQLC